MTAFVLLGAESVEKDVSLLLGQIFVGGLLLAAILKSCSRKPGLNVLCMMSLPMALGAWLLGVVISNRWVQGVSLLHTVGSLGIVHLGVGGVVVAIMGLASRRRRPGQRGGGRAVAALILGGILLVLMGVGFVRGVLKGTALPPAAPENIASSGGALVFDELNLRYYPPAESYVSLDVKKFNPAATFGLMRRNPQVMFMVVAERAPDTELGPEGLAEVSKANLKTASRNVRFSGETRRRINGVDGVLFYTDAEVRGKELCYVHWAAAQRGYFYQFIAFGEPRDREEIRHEAEMLFARFELIDPNRQAGPAGDEAPWACQSPFGYSVDMKGASWREWATVTSKVHAAQVGGERGNYSCFIVSSLFYGKERPVSEAVRQALLGVLDIAPSDSLLTNARPIQEAGMDGQTLDFRRTGREGTYLFRLKILQGAQCAYLLAVWSKEKKGDPDALAQEVAAHVRFVPGGATSVDLAAVSPSQRRGQATLLNNLGLYYFSAKQHEAALRWFQQAAALAGDSEVYAGNVLNVLNRLGRHEQAIAFLDSLSVTLGGAQTLRAWRATHLKALGRFREAADLFGELFSHDFHDDEAFATYVDCLSAEARWAEAQAAFDSYLQGHDSVHLGIRRCELSAAQGNFAQAVEMLRSLQTGRDYNTEIAYALVRNYRSLGQPKEALSVCEEMVAKGFASADAYYLKGRAECDLKWYRNAKDSWTKALELDPSSEIIRQALRDVSGMLGEGDNSLVRNAIEPVPLPKPLADQLPSLAPRDANGYGAVYVSRIVGYSFQKGKDLRHTAYMRIKVFDAGGVSRFSTIPIEFDPLFEEVFVNDLVVRDEAGKIVSRGQVSEYYVIDNPAAEGATTSRVLYLPVPQLQAGHTIELAVTHRRRGAPQEFGFVANSMKAMRPVLLSGFYYLGDANAIRHKAPRGPTPQSVEGGLAWVLKDVGAFQWEPMQPDFAKLVPMVYVCDANTSWSAVAGDYLRKIADRLVLDEQTRQLAKDLTGDANSPAAKAAALARYVQTACTYKAIEFGRRALVPNSPQQTLAHKYGDCKDHAVLLQQMLEAVGVPAFLALVGHSEFQEDLPSLDQFDHMVVYVPGLDGGRFLDATRKGLDPSAADVPPGLAGRTALLIDPNRPRLLALPEYAPGAGKARVERRVEIHADRAVHVLETATLEGIAAELLREHLKSMEQAKHSDWARSVIAGAAKGARLASFHISDLRDNARPLVIELVYDVDNGAQKAGGDLVFRLPDDWERDYLGVQQMKREEPFRFSWPIIVESAVTVVPPTGFAVESPSGGGGEMPCARWRSSVEAKPDACTIRLRGELIAGTFPADQYGRLFALMEEAVGTIAAEVRCKPLAGK